jgi:hypothetical protein
MGNNARRKHKQNQKPGRESNRRPLDRSRKNWIFRTLVALAIIGGIAAWQWPGTLWGYKSAPSFTLQSSTGRAVSLVDFRGKKEVVLIFYMGAG